MPAEAATTANLRLTTGQTQALEMIWNAVQQPRGSVSIVAGYAGTGKTTATRVVADQIGVPMVVTPTGKAAMRVTEATGLFAQTIHRWMYRPAEDPETGVVRFMRRKLDEIEIPKSRLILLDEASMVGPDVWKDVHQLCRDLDLHLVCIGDTFQLPPVQPPGAPPFSLLDPDFAVTIGAQRVELTEILRQAQDSPIIRASMRLRTGERAAAFRELQRIGHNDLGTTAVACHNAGGVTICHRNVTRYQINAGLRYSLGKDPNLPEPGEPLMVLKNVYDIGVYNGETVTFEGWGRAPDEQSETVKDRYKRITEFSRLGSTTLSGAVATLSVEQLHGRLASNLGAIAATATKWARRRGILLGDSPAPHLHANFGYCYTAHKSQGSQWPYVLVLLEPSVRLDDVEGRRWAYTAITRAEKSAAIFFGGL